MAACSKAALTHTLNAPTKLSPINVITIPLMASGRTLRGKPYTAMVAVITLAEDLSKVVGLLNSKDLSYYLGTAEAEKRTSPLWQPGKLISGNLDTICTTPTNPTDYATVSGIQLRRAFWIC